MSLQVWLPMTKDLRQQGIADTSTIALASGNTFIDGGKLGNKALHLTKQQTILGTSSCMSGKKQMSYAFWVKVNTAWSAQWLDGIAWCSTDGSSVAYSRQEFYTNCTRIGTWFSGSSLSGYVFTPGEWTHIVGTFDYTTGIAKFYINGVLQGTSTSLSKTHYCRGDFYLGDSGVDIVENDVRIYDHCLSPMEVKRLAQGLVLHYPLNRNGWGQENLLNGTYDLSNWLMYGSCSIVADVGNQKKVKYNATAAWRGVWMSHCIDYQNVRNKTVTISGKFYAEEGASCVIGLTVFVCANAIQGTSSATERKYKDVAINFTGNGEWQTVSHTITITDSIFITGSFVPDFDNCYFSLYYSASSAGSAEYYGKNFKMEFGEKITPWCPNLSDTLATTMGLNSTTEYDCSGFCNNGTRTGTFTWTSDTPKYSVSQYFNGSSYIVTDYYSTLGTDNFTIAAWVKIELNSSKTYQPIIINKDTGAASAGCGIYFNHNQNKFLWSTADGSVATEIWTANTFFDIYDKWVHVVMVRDSNDAKKGCFYINGIREELASVPVIRDVTNNIYPMVIGAIGPHNYSTYQYTGNLSDVRVYATALSAEEVLSLYQNSATIDSNGVIHGQIR